MPPSPRSFIASCFAPVLLLLAAISPVARAQTRPRRSPETPLAERQPGMPPPMEVENPYLEPARKPEPAAPARGAPKQPPLPPRPVPVVVAPPASAPGAAPLTLSARPPLEAVYDNGIFLFTRDRSFSARLSLRTQLRLESTRSLEPGSELYARFVFARARLLLEGNAFGPSNRYKLEYGLGDRGSFGFVRDVFVEKALGGSGVWVRVGQWKRPFNRQELVSDFASEFNERALTSDFTGGGRDVGLALHNDYEKSPDGVEWVLGVFNGFSGGSDRPPIQTTCTTEGMAVACTTPAPTNVPADFSPALVARLGWNSGGIKGYSEGDMEGGPLRVALGASYKVDLADLSPGSESSVARNLSHGVDVDGMIKVRGFSLLLAGYVMKIRSAARQPAGLAQVGYFLAPRKAQTAVRFAFVPTTGDRKQIEARLAFNWFWSAHNWKWATDVGFQKQTGRDDLGRLDQPDLELRTMAQMAF